MPQDTAACGRGFLDMFLQREPQLPVAVETHMNAGCAIK